MNNYVNVYQQDHVKRAMCFIISQFEAELMDANDVLAGGSENLKAILDSVVDDDSVSLEAMEVGKKYLYGIYGASDTTFQANFMRLINDTLMDLVKDATK